MPGGTAGQGRCHGVFGQVWCVILWLLLESHQEIIKDHRLTWQKPRGESRLFTDTKCFSFTIISSRLFCKGSFEIKCWQQNSWGACHITSCSRKDFGYRCRFTLLGYEETTLIMCQELLLLIGHCAVATSWNLSWNEMFFFLSSVCVCYQGHS